ncbi:MAG TPA: hypothetical protein VJ998_03800 [Pseudomonadales bacterium]|nr:hypothetical protein [Pseudomonadales bacterium]
MLLRFIKDPLVRRFFTGTLFALTFVWVAVRYFNVDQEVVRVFVILTFVVVGLLIVAGFFSSFVLHLFMRRKSGGMLDKFEENIDEDDPDEKPDA